MTAILRSESAELKRQQAMTKPDAKAELAPCPFCGPGQSMVSLWFDDVSKRWAIGCGRCGSSSGRSVHAKGSREAAIKSWNTRSASTPIPGREAVAWRVKNDFGHWYITQLRATAETWRDTEKFDVQPLYATPPTQPALKAVEEDELVEFFRGEGYSRFGWDGDERGWSTERTAIEAMRELIRVEAQLASARKALEAERDYWAEEVSDCAADLGSGAPFTDAVRDRISYCAERAERLNRALNPESPK